MSTSVIQSKHSTQSCCKSTELSNTSLICLGGSLLVLSFQVNCINEPKCLPCVLRDSCLCHVSACIPDMSWLSVCWIKDACWPQMATESATEHQGTSSPSLPSQLKLDKNLIFLSSNFCWNDRYEILHMTRQQSCRGMCKISWWYQSQEQFIVCETTSSHQLLPTLVT